MNQYPITYLQKEIGSAVIEKQGLFYIIRCNCSIVTDQKLRIYAHNGSEEIDLGICIPSESKLSMVKRIRSDQIDLQRLKFEIKESVNIQNNLYAINDDEPFDMLEQLDCAVFKRANGKAYILISNPTGQ